jgi:hypothetical protein
VGRKRGFLRWEDLRFCVTNRGLIGSKTLCWFDEICLTIEKIQTVMRRF